VLVYSSTRTSLNCICPSHTTTSAVHPSTSIFTEQLLWYVYSTSSAFSASIHLLGLLSTTYVYRVSLSVLNILLCLSTVNSFSRTSPPPQLTLPLPPCTYWLYSSSRISLLPLLPTTHPISMVSHITLLSVRLIRLYCLILHHLSCSLPSSIHLGFLTHAHSWYLQ
jgi:hypothetical protein